MHDWLFSGNTPSRHSESLRPVVPVLLGRSIRLFDDTQRVDLELTRVLESPGVSHLGFCVT